MIAKQIGYGALCMIAGFGISVATSVGAITPKETVGAAPKLSHQCKQRTIDDNLLVICPNSESGTLRNMLK